MTTTDPTAPATPGEALRWAVKRLMARPDAGEMHIAAAWLAVWADDLDAARATDPAPATPPELRIKVQRGGTIEQRTLTATPPEHQPGARTYELPAEPPPEVTQLWDREGVRWQRVEPQPPYGADWAPRELLQDKPPHVSVEATDWAELVYAAGPLSTTPPAGTDPASTAVDLPAGMHP